MSVKKCLHYKQNPMKHTGAPEHTLPTGQYLTHAHNPNTLAVAATDSCFVLISMAQPQARGAPTLQVIWVCACVRYCPYRGVLCASVLKLVLSVPLLPFFQGLKPEPRRVWSQVYYNHDFPTSKPLLLSRCNICWSIEPTLSKTETFRTGPDSPS